MDSIDDIKEEIVRLSEAISNLATQNTQDETLRKELKILANDLTERIHLLGFAYHVFNESAALVHEPEDETVEEPVVVEASNPIEENNPEIEEAEEIASAIETPKEDEIIEEGNEEKTIKAEEEFETPQPKKEEQPISETAESLNEKISKLSQSESLANKLQNQPIKNLKTAIGLNERFLFANELFAGDGGEYNRAIEEFNHLESLDAALRLIEHKYQPQYHWDFDDRTVQNFLLYLKRRFSYRESA